MYNKSQKISKTHTIPVTLTKAISKSNFTVYLAKSQLEDTKYAMKVFPYVRCEPNPCYLRERRVLGLSHPNLISIADHEEFTETVTSDGKRSIASYILMELAPHGDLSEFILGEKLPICEKLVRTIFHHIADGVKYLHDNNLAHCDLKPENILLGEHYIPKIADFDSLVYINQKEKLTRPGSPNYRAPEVAFLQSEDISAVDIYSLGIILLILMLREFPYNEDSLYRGYDLQKLLQEGDDAFWRIHPSGQKLNLSLEKEFKELVFGMMKKDPKERYSLEQIMNNAWYKEAIYNKNEYRAIMKKCDV